MKSSLQLILKNKNYLLIFIIFIYPIFFIWHGGDLTDTGFFAVNYNFAFENYANGKTNSLFILTDFIGAIWLKLFPFGGIVGLRILTLLFLYGAMTITYMTLKDLTTNKTILLIGLLTGLAFSTRFTSLIFNYDIASTFFLVLMLYLLCIGIKLNKPLFFAYSGMVLFLAFLTRFPNIVFIVGLPIIMLLNSFLNKGVNIKNILKNYIFYCGGFLLFFILFYTILNTNETWEVYLNNLSLLSSESKNSNSYSLSTIFRQYFNELKQFTPHFLIVIFLVLPTSIVYVSSSKKSFYFVIYSLLILGIATLYYSGFSYKNNIKYFMPAFCLIPLIISLLKKDKYLLIILLAITVSLTQVAGSNTGLFLKLSNGALFLIPLSLIMLYDYNEFSIYNIKIKTKPLFIIGGIILLFFSVVIRVGTVYHVDSGLSARLRCNQPIEHPKMKGLLTSKGNASYIKEMSTAISLEIDTNESLFIYGHQPIFYYLANQYPPVNNFWLANNVVNAKELFVQLEESVNLKHVYPLIVDTKEKVLASEGDKELNIFLTKHNYYTVTNNERFIIWKTNNK